METDPPRPVGERPAQVLRRTWRALWQKRTVEDIVASSRAATGGTARTLDHHTLVLIGFAVLIGAGIFRLTTPSIGANGGLNTVLAFGVAGLSFLATARCYAEFASMVPVAGSAFTYAQAGIGRGAAWGIGSLLLIEYGVGAAAVSMNLASDVLGEVPAAVPVGAMAFVVVLGTALARGGLRACAARLIVGATYVKLLFIAVLVVGGLVLVVRSTPTGHAAPDLGAFDAGSVAAALSVVFFAYAGFDGVTTAADEATSPWRDLPRAMLRALSLTIVIYIALVLVVATVRNGQDDSSLAAIFTALDEPFLASLAKAAAIIGQATVAYVLLYGLSRIMNSMWRELRPEVDPGPAGGDGSSSVRLTSAATVFVLLPIVASSALPTSTIRLTDMVSTATALAFGLIVVGTAALRHNRPDLLRTYRVPLLPVVVVVAVLANGVVLFTTTRTTWIGILGVVAGVLLVCGCTHRPSRPPGDRAPGIGTGAGVPERARWRADEGVASK